MSRCISRKFYPALLIILIFLNSCGGPHIDGTSQKTFKASAEKIRSTLSKDDTITFNNAIRVIAFSSMGEQMQNNQQYKGMTIEAIVMKKIDGKTFGDIKDMANDLLKTEKQREIASAQQAINELQTDMKKRKAEYDSLKIKLSAIQGSLLKIDHQGNAIMMSCEFKNTSKQDLDHYTLSIVARSNSKKTLIFNSLQMFGGVKTLHPQDTVMQYLTLSKYDMDQAPEVPWNTIKYPVTNPEKYNFKVEIYAQELKMDDKDYDLSSVKWSESDQEDYDKNMKELQKQLKNAQNSHDNLDDI
jgi:hypothetical protein